MNYIGIVVAAVASWMAGAAWYGVLGTVWMSALGRSKAEMMGPSGKPSPGPFILSFVAEIVMAAMLSGIIVHIGEVTVRRGAVSGLFIWFGFVLTTVATNYAYARQKPMLTVIDGGHWLVVLLIQGAIVGAFGPG